MSQKCLAKPEDKPTWVQLARPAPTGYQVCPASDPWPGEGKRPRGRSPVCRVVYGLAVLEPSDDSTLFNADWTSSNLTGVPEYLIEIICWAGVCDWLLPEPTAQTDTGLAFSRFPFGHLYYAGEIEQLHTRMTEEARLDRPFRTTSALAPAVNPGPPKSICADRLVPTLRVLFMVDARTVLVPALCFFTGQTRPTWEGAFVGNTTP